MSGHCFDRGVALVTALFTLLTCTVLLTVSIRLVSHYKNREHKLVEGLRARLAAEAGIAYTKDRLSGGLKLEEISGLNGRNQTIDDRVSFRLDVALRLGYLWVRSTGFSGGERYEVEALLGNIAPPETDPALVIRKASHELFASGRTRITGDAVIPGGKLKSKALHNLPSAPSPVILGRIRPAALFPIQKNRPWILFQARTLLLETKSLTVGLSKMPGGSDWSLNGAVFKFKNNLEVPLDLKKIEGPGTILVKGDLGIPGDLILRGDVRMVASGSIRVHGNLDLGATLVAGASIEVSGGARGIAALIARETIDLSERVFLDMPSLCGLFKVPELGNVSRNRILLRGGRFHGALFTWDQRAWPEPLILVDSGTDIAGFLYASGSLNLKAPFQGHVTTNRLQASSGAQTFDNWLKNLSIERAPEKTEWVLPLGFGKDVGVMEWIRR